MENPVAPAGQLKSELECAWFVDMSSVEAI